MTGARISRYLITGGYGQLGGELAKCLGRVKGKNNVILTDVVDPPHGLDRIAKCMKLDVLDRTAVKQEIVNNEITCLIHLAALLSATAERKLAEAFELNVNSLSTVFLLAKEHRLQLYVPSTIAAFGPDSPLSPAVDVCVQRPHTLYGVGKVYCERLGEYFNAVHGVDFRSLRYPGIISATPPGGGTTDYAVDVFFQGCKAGSYDCYLESDTPLPFMHIQDCMENTVKFLLAPQDTLKQRVYNVGAMSFTPKQLFSCIKDTCLPRLNVSYKIDPVRQRIANQWPKSMDFSHAVRDWGLQNKFDLKSMVQDVYKDVASMTTLGSGLTAPNAS